MYSQGFVVRGRLSEADWRAFLEDCTRAMGMTPAGDPGVWRYPLDGKGGSGLTMMQPITESFLALDTWPDHDGAYLFVCSCKPFDAGNLIAPMRRFGLGRDDMTERATLRL